MPFIVYDKKPSNCSECNYRCGLNILERGDNPYADGCILGEELPETYGELKDASILLNKLRRKIEDYPKNKDGTRDKDSSFFIDGLYRAIDLIEHTHSVIKASK